MPETYRGSKKHKNRPSQGQKGTMCPEWSHATDTGAALADVTKHPWPETTAGRLFAGSEPCPEGRSRKYATAKGVAFVAVPTNDGTWHGYPVPWQDVPAALKTRWQAAGLVKLKDFRRYMERSKDDIFWALETDHEE